MKQSLILFLILVLNGSSSLYSQVIDSGNHIIAEKCVLVGSVDRLELQSGDYGNVFIKEYKAYEPCTKVLSKIDPLIFNQRITIVLGTWCHDSQVQVPRIFKILDKLDYNTNDIKVIMVDTNKSAGDTDIEDLGIELVPTFIFNMDGKETGRIIESPQASLEKDILAMFQN